MFVHVAEDERLHGTEVTEEDRANLRYIPANQEWPECGQEAASSDISRSLGQVS